MCRNERILGSSIYACVNKQKLSAYHKGFKIRAPPLSEAVSYFPFVIDPVGGVKLPRIDGGSEALIETAFEAFYFVLTRFEVVTWTDILSDVTERSKVGGFP